MRSPEPILVSAPSNIALVKYMGKLPEGRNLPANPSVSMTLSELATRIELVPESGSEGFRWAGLAPESAAGRFAAPEVSLPLKKHHHLDRHQPKREAI